MSGKLSVLCGRVRTCQITQGPTFEDSFGTRLEVDDAEVGLANLLGKEWGLAID